MVDVATVGSRVCSSSAKKVYSYSFIFTYSDIILQIYVPKFDIWVLKNYSYFFGEINSTAFVFLFPTHLHYSINELETVTSLRLASFVFQSASNNNIHACPLPLAKKPPICKIVTELRNKLDSIFSYPKRRLIETTSGGIRTTINPLKGTVPWLNPTDVYTVNMGEKRIINDFFEIR